MPNRRIEIIVNEHGQREAVSIFIYRWSNFSVKEWLYNLRIGGEGKQATLDLDYPADKAVQAISKLIEKTQKAPGAPSAK